MSRLYLCIRTRSYILKKLSDRIISLYSKVGDLVFNPFLSTNALSAIDLGINFVGFKLSNEFFNISQDEIEQG